MPKKPAGKNAFFYYMQDYKQKEEKRGIRMDMRQASEDAGKIWTTMSVHERAPFVDRAKNEKLKYKGTGEKYSSQGVPLSRIENNKREKDLAERLVKKEIENTIRICVANDSLATHKFYFVMVNYFVKTSDNVFVPAEISLCEYSLRDGISNKFHSFINPGELGIGLAYEATQHADLTHRLPLPPSAMGEKNFGKLFEGIINFIQSGNQDCVLPPIYTFVDAIPIVKSAVAMLQADYFDEDNLEINVFPLQYLYYTLKKATAVKGEVKEPESIFVSDAILERDQYEYTEGIACDYHDKLDAGKFCTLSFVVRWGFMFSDYMCYDLALKLIPGTHIPLNSDTSMIAPALNDTYMENTKSGISLANSFASSSIVTNITQPIIERKYIEERKHNTSQYEDDYPSLGGSSKQSRYKILNSSKTEDVNIKQENPWSVRSKNPPRLPIDDSLKFSSIAIGKGRGIIKNEQTASNFNSSTTGSFGKGRFLQD